MGELRPLDDFPITDQPYREPQPDGWESDFEADEWQHRDVAGPLTAEELHDLVRREVEATAKVDVYAFADGVTVVLPSERKDDPGTSVFRRMFVEASATVGWGLVDAWVGAPVSLLLPPADLPGAVFYAAGVAALGAE
jgi:hypothetical protein